MHCTARISRGLTLGTKFMRLLHFILIYTYFWGLFGTLTARSGTDFSQANWEKIGEDEGIQVYRWSVPGSGLFAFRAEGDVASPIANVASALVDINRRHEWMPSLGETRIVKVVSPTERVEYTHIKTPFIIKDRDFVMHNKATFFPETQEILFAFHSVEEPSAPPTSRVRGEIHASFYRLKVINGGVATHVEFVVHVDPRGSLPGWIVNLFAEKNPLRTIRNLRIQSAKSDVQPNQDVLDALQGKGILK